MMKAGLMLAAVGWLGAGLCWADFTVVIDPGHGGTPAPGKADSTQEGDGASWNNARSPSGQFLEKDLALSYSLAMKKAFQESPKAKEMGVRVVLTREQDVHLSAMERAAVAVRESADVFLSVHFNAANGVAEGTRVFYVAANHPRWEYMHFVNPYEGRDRKFSELLAQKVAYSLQPFGGKPDKRVVADDARDRRDGLRLLGFVRQDTHLRNAAVALLEVEFLDNPQVEGWLLSDLNRAKAEAAVAGAVVETVCEWAALPAAARDEVQKARKAPGR
jgi:N-acetylmuramoyl-L-alanine amidase